MINLSINEVMNCGLNQQSACEFVDNCCDLLKNCHHSEQAWQLLSSLLTQSSFPFSLHLYIFTKIFPNWREHPEKAAAWQPSTRELTESNIARLMKEFDFSDVKNFHQWSAESYESFWKIMLEKLPIIFKNSPTKICDLTQGIESPSWFPDAKLNIADSCFSATDSTIAIICQDHDNNLSKMTYQELNHLSNKVANSLVKLGYSAGDAIGMIMPMTISAVVIYLGILKMGGVVVSIADSFSSQEIAARLEIAHAKLVFTQDFLQWGGKQIPLYEKIKNAYSGPAIILALNQSLNIDSRAQDYFWNDFLIDDIHFVSVPCNPMDNCHILFSSGTTAQPKAIPWNHTTPIKVASDAYFHQNIQANDVLAWPTNLGWMMGPWLIFATFINKATLALYPDIPKDRHFGEFVEKAKVTMLGVVPTLVSAWRQTNCMQNLNWRSIKTFSSTGECSNPEDMLYLMSLAGYKPVIEYCGGTEIGGSYVTSTVIEKNYPSLFSTPSMGLNFVILDEKGQLSDIGEVALIPPSIGLSTTLLNADHYHVYFENMPQMANKKCLRRHGDQIKKLSNGYYTMLGRNDDAMNLGGIKISAAEIERAIAGIADIVEVAAIAINANHGPSLLIIYAITSKQLDKTIVLQEMQKQINQKLNPLFKIHDIIFIKELPRTASNKVMRRTLRDDYHKKINC